MCSSSMRLWALTRVILPVVLLSMRPCSNARNEIGTQAACVGVLFAATQVRHKMTVPSPAAPGAADASQRRKRLKPKLSKDK